MWFKEEGEIRNSYRRKLTKMDKISPYKGCTRLLSQCLLYGLILVNFCSFLPIGKSWVLSLTSCLQVV